MAKSRDKVVVRKIFGIVTFSLFFKRYFCIKFFIFSFGEDGKPGEDQKTADESGESSESRKSESDGPMKKKMSLTSPADMASPTPQIRTVP